MHYPSCSFSDSGKQQTPSGVTISYKQPGKEGVCETTPGVDSYSGYIEIAPDAHVFFWYVRPEATDHLCLVLRSLKVLRVPPRPSA